MVLFCFVLNICYLFFYLFSHKNHVPCLPVYSLSLSLSFYLCISVFLINIFTNRIGTRNSVEIANYRYGNEEFVM